jgi:DNA-directed RNA polymerase II subunit RPB2
LILYGFNINISIGKNWQQQAGQNLIWEVKFGQVSVSEHPRMLELDNRYFPMFPHESRIRNLTYSTELYADITFSQKEMDDYYEENPQTQVREKKVKSVLKEYKKEKVFIGKVPVMLRSKFCQLKKFNEMQRVKNGKDCSFDQGGYFIINGSEKVIVAQERMGNNQVNVFAKKPPSKYSWVAEIRSQAETSNRPPQLFTMQMKSSQRGKAAAPGPRENSSIYCTIPLIRESIPLVILFRALNCTSDKQILTRICFDCPNDSDMREALRASLEEAKIIQSQEDALDYIAKRGIAQTYVKEKRIVYAKLLLETEFLPHVSTKSNGALQKSFFLGYMANKLIKASIGVITEDDRDYYGKKRLDMAGSLLSTHFRQLFKQYTEVMQKILKKDIDSGVSDIDIKKAMKHEIITRGLKTALATGNWGKDKNGETLKTGVAQVLNRLTFMSSISHLRRLNTPIAKTGKLAKPR